MGICQTQELKVSTSTVRENCTIFQFLVTHLPAVQYSYNLILISSQWFSSFGLFLYNIHAKLHFSNNSRITLSTSSHFYLTNSITLSNVSTSYGSGFNSVRWITSRTKSVIPKVAWMAT